MRCFSRVPPDARTLSSQSWWLLLQDGVTAMHTVLRATHTIVTSDTWLLLLLLLLLLLQDGWTPVHWAAQNGNLAVLKKLLAAGAGVNAANAVRPPPSG
jgi:ankyrin repeat protein